MEESKVHNLEQGAKEFDGITIYFWWNIWREHNQIIFQNASLQPL
jgi:hypothetical protein